MEKSYQIPWSSEEIKILCKLKFGEKLSNNDIADEMKRSFESVKSKLRHMKEDIRMGDKPYRPEESGYIYGDPQSKIEGLKEIGKMDDLEEERMDSIRKMCNFKNDFSSKLSATHPYMIVKMPDRIKEKVKIIPIGDFHYGAKNCSVEKIKEWIRWLQTKDNTYAILMGDLVENSNKHSVADSIYQQVIQPEQQKLDLIEMLAPIRHKILCLLEGNHGRRTIKEVGLSPEKDIAKFLEIPYYSDQCYLDITYRDHLFEIFATHGTSGSTTDAGRINAIMKPGKFTNADIFLYAHTHDKFVKESMEVIRDRKTMELKMRKVYYVNTGSFLSYWESYAAQKLYTPSPVGTVCVELFENGDTHCKS